jgi:hypothetical protein
VNLPTRPGRSRTRYVTEHRHRAQAQTNKRKSELPPETGVADHPPTAAEVLCGQKVSREAEGQGKEAGIGLLRGAGQARQSQSGPWRVYATAPLVHGSTQIPPAQYTAIPSSPCRGTRPPVIGRRASSRPSWLLRGCWVFWPGTHARHGLKRLVVLGQRRCAAAQFSLTQYNHAWPRADRGHQINRTGSPLTDPPRPHETYSHHANVRPRSLSPRPPRPLRPGPSLTAFALTNRLPMPPCFCRAT